ncbi:MAG: DUF3822 family protein [Chitinophagaceae bacterium]|nr:DUF3822 family protein [Chitinophagaceae bacterium]
MSLHEHLFIDDSYLANNGQLPTIAYISLGKNYIHYTISSHDKSRLLFVKSLHNPNGNIAQDEFDHLLTDQLLRHCATVNIAIDTQKQILMPAKLLFDENPAIYFEGIYDIEKDEEIGKQEIDADITELYLLKKNTVAYLKNVFNEIKIYSQSACIVKTQMQIQSAASGICIHTSHDTFHLSFFKNQQLHFYQSFDFKAASDILYCILNVLQWQQAGMKDVKVLLTGFATIQQEIATLLSTYFEMSTFESKSEGKQSFDTEHFPAHILFHQYSLILCAS